MEKQTIVVALGLIFLVKTTAANDTQSINNKVSIRLHSGFLTGKTTAMIYDNPQWGEREASRLQWQYHNIPVIKTDLTWRPIAWLTTKSSYSTTLTHRQCSMHDYDYECLYDKNNCIQYHLIFNHSSHPHTRLNKAWQWDNQVYIWLLQQSDFALSLVSGYHQSIFSWTSYGGNYRYHFSDRCFKLKSNIKVNSYHQKLTTPYVGMAGYYRYNNWETGIQTTFSLWLTSKARDNHYLRSTVYRDTINNQRYYHFTAYIAFYLKEHIQLFIERRGSWIANKRGNTRIAQSSSGEVTYSLTNNATSLKHRHYAMTAGINYGF